jgi:hypothetical protein
MRCRGHTGKTLRRIVNKFIELFRRNITRTMHKRCAPRIETYLFKQALDCFGPYFGPVIALRKRAFAQRAGHDADSPHSPFKGVKHVLRVDFPAARDFLYPDMHFTFHPLDGQANALRDAVLAEIYDDIGGCLVCHCAHVRLLTNRPRVLSLHPPAKTFLKAPAPFLNEKI